MTETQFGLKVETIRLDHAVKLGYGLEAKIYYADKGILHQTICAYAPQQNGAVERKQKYLLETSRALTDFAIHLFGEFSNRNEIITKAGHIEDIF